METKDQNGDVTTPKDVELSVTISNGTKDKIPPQSISISPWQQLLNALVVHFWVGPLVVMYWACSWNLVIRELIFPEDIDKSIWTSAAIGFGIYFIASCSQGLLSSICRQDQNAGIGSVIFSILVSRGYTYVMAFASVNQWRSIWNAWDTYTSMSTHNALFTFLSAYLIMFLLRCSTQVLAAPSFAALDVPMTTYFDTTTYLGTKVGTWQHVLDSLFTAIVVPILVVTAWRGVWYLSDKWLAPDDILLSAAYSLALAYGIAALCLLTRGLWKKMSVWSDDGHLLVKYLLEDTHTFLHSFVAISHWRGFWILYEQDFLEYRLRFWLGHAIAYALLTITLCSNSFVPRGCFRDGVETGGKGIELDMYYVTNLYQMWKKTKTKSKADGKPPNESCCHLLVRKTGGNESKSKNKVYDVEMTI